MTLDPPESCSDILHEDAATIATFVASLDTLRLQMIESAINEELTLRCEGKPFDRTKLH
jgi:hypothetical protein